DAPARRAEVRELGARFRRWHVEVAQPAIAARRRNELGETAALVATSGRELSREFDELATSITRVQSAVVRARILDSIRVRAAATRWVVGGVILTMGSAIALGVFLGLQL